MRGRCSGPPALFKLEAFLAQWQADDILGIGAHPHLYDRHRLLTAITAQGAATLWMAFATQAGGAQPASSFVERPATFNAMPRFP